MTGTFSALYWCLCVIISFTFYYSIILMAQLAFFPVNNAPSRLHKRGKVSNWAIFYWKCPAENAGNGISETLNWNIFWGNMPTEPPTLGHLRCYNVYSPCEYTFKISRYAPEVAILFDPESYFMLTTDCPSLGFFWNWHKKNKNHWKKLQNRTGISILSF